MPQLTWRDVLDTKRPYSTLKEAYVAAWSVGYRFVTWQGAVYTREFDDCHGYVYKRVANIGDVI